MDPAQTHAAPCPRARSIKQSLIAKKRVCAAGILLCGPRRAMVAAKQTLFDIGRLLQADVRRKENQTLFSTTIFAICRIRLAWVLLKLK
jgi:hypothetical protein